MNLSQYLKSAFYLFAAFAISGAVAGSYDDFFSAIRIDDAGTINKLLQRGFDPNSRDPNGQPGLVLALRESSLRAAAVLVSSPAVEVDAANSVGESALMLAALKGELGLCRQLLGRGASVNRPGWSPLHYAASGPQAAVIALLLEQGAEIDAGSPNLTTPLMMAARYGNEASVDLLLARGADPRRRNEQGLAAADFARLGGREWLVRRLSESSR